MDRDFTLQKYRELCKAIVENYIPMTVESYLVNKPSQNYIAILRHDVDRDPKNALRMAKLEHDYDIKSTYYFRMKKNVFIPEIIREIAEMGHEIGYHYEVLDKARGDFEKAIKIFEQELKEFRRICKVKTVCMHGNPLTPWINVKIWDKYDFKSFDIIGEPYISLDKEFIYLSDTGRTWSGRFSIKDKTTRTNSLKIKNTDELIKLMKQRKMKKLHILTHPNRWYDEYSKWIAELILQNLKNTVKFIIISLGGRR